MKSRFSAAFCGVALAATAFVVQGCGGGSGGYSSPTTPAPVGGGGGGGAATTISIVGNRGAQSFAPNPANASQGSTIAWKNNDSVTHHIVFDDGSGDAGNIGPGSTSQAVTLGSNGARYHCTIHPSMVGSINSSTGTPPPCTGPYCS